MSRPPRAPVRRSTVLLVLGAVAAALAAAAAPGATPEPARRPRIGLVLSGGGARGAAHIGVLKVLRDLRVPVDCIAGTSMGAVVGGLYAAGMTPEEMEAALTAVDWQDMFNDRPSRKDLRFHSKEDDLSYLAPFELGLKRWKLVLPSGLVAGQKMAFLLKTLTMRVVDVRRFDDLPIPFRAVATDIVTGEMVVLSQGDLAEAIRASMSVPGAFTPVELDGRLLVDGGMVRNLPVDIARSLGADVLIAVNVSTPPLGRDGLDTVTRVSSQVLALLMRENVSASLAGADVVVTPDLDGFRASDFPRVAAIIPRGETAARASAGALARFAVDEDAYAGYERRRTGHDVTAVRIESVQVATGAPVDPRIIMRRIRTRPQQPLDLETLRGDLARIYELGDFQLVDFSLLETEQGYGLLIDAREKPWGPTYVRFGLNLSADLQGRSAFNLLASVRVTRLNTLGAEWKTQVQVGETPLARTELYQPLDWGGNWFVAPFVEHASQRIGRFEGERRVAEYRVRTDQVGLMVGRQLGRIGAVTVGVVRGRGRGSVDSGTPAVRSFDANRAGVVGQLIIDQLDNTGFPTSGTFATADVYSSRTALGADEAYSKAALEALQAVTAGRTTFIGSLRLYSSVGSTLPYHDRFTMGGLFSLAGFEPGQISGDKGGVAALFGYYRLARLPPGTGGGLYAGLGVEAGNLWEDGDPVELGGLRRALTVLVGADTVVGPVYLAYGLASGGHDSFYVYVGRTF